MLRGIPQKLWRLYDEQDVPVKLGVIGIAIVLLAGLQQAVANRPHRMTKLELQQLRTEAEEEALQAVPEARAAARRAKEHPQRALVIDRIDPHTPVTKLAGHTGRASFQIQYADGFFDVGDVRHWESTADPDPVELTSDRHSVAGGNRGQVMVGGCCEGGDARVEVVLRDRAPSALPPRGFREVSDMDLDLTSGDLLFTADYGTQRVVMLRPGYYRMRVAGVGAREFEQARERFRIELWPRGRSGVEADGALKVLRRTAD